MKDFCAHQNCFCMVNKEQQSSFVFSFSNQNVNLMLRCWRILDLIEDSFLSQFQTQNLVSVVIILFFAIVFNHQFVVFNVIYLCLWFMKQVSSWNRTMCSGQSSSQPMPSLSPQKMPANGNEQRRYVQTYIMCFFSLKSLVINSTTIGSHEQ